MSIFRTDMFDERIAEKKKEDVINKITGAVLKQIEAAAKIGLLEIEVNYADLCKRAIGNMSESFCMNYYRKLISILCDDEDFDVLEQAYTFSNGDFNITISWRECDNFSTAASKMFKITKENWDNFATLTRMRADLLYSAREEGKAIAVIPYKYFGIRVELLEEDKWYVKLEKLEKEISKHPIYKYIKEYESDFLINVRDDGLQVVYAG